MPYKSIEKRRAYQKEYQKRWRITDIGKHSCAVSQRKFRESEKRRVYRKKYRKSIRGKVSEVYNSIMQRCNNSKHKKYEYYGGRGIRCLFKSGNEFADYVIDELKIDPRGLQIHRIDNDGHYERGNIVFVTREEHRKLHVKGTR